MSNATQYEILNFHFDIYVVNPAYALPGKEVLAYRSNRNLIPAFSDHTMTFVKTVMAPTEKQAVAKL